MITENLRGIANASGYPFQIAVQERLTSGSSGWKLLGDEVPWKGEDGESGFADIMVESREYPAVRAIIECKRVRDGRWVFLEPSKTKRTTNEAVCYWAQASQSGTEFGWCEVSVRPTSAQARFCAVRGSGERDAPYLERLARGLLRSVEEIASAESLVGRIPLGEGLAYLPIVVTNAELFLCTCPPHAIPLESGDIAEVESTFESVGHIRFRKSLDTNVKRALASKRRGSVKDLASGLERTVFVVNAGHLDEFFAGFSTQGSVFGI